MIDYMTLVLAIAFLVVIVLCIAVESALEDDE